MVRLHGLRRCGDIPRLAVDSDVVRRALDVRCLRVELVGVGVSWWCVHPRIS